MLINNDWANIKNRRALLEWEHSGDLYKYTGPALDTTGRATFQGVTNRFELLEVSTQNVADFYRTGSGVSANYGPFELTAETADLVGQAPLFVVDGGGHRHYIPVLWDPERHRVSKGNPKTLIPSANLLAGDKSADYVGLMFPALRFLATVGGTCTGTCPDCYALESTRYIDKFIMELLNTLEARQDPRRYVEMVEKEIYRPRKKPAFFRIHDSGDFFSFPYFVAWLEMIERHPETRFGAYTKEAGPVLLYGPDNLPGNLSLSCSPWPGVCEPIANLARFYYDDGTDPRISALPHCPAVDRNGKRTGRTCNKCLHCYTCKPGDEIAVYPH